MPIRFKNSKGIKRLYFKRKLISKDNLKEKRRGMPILKIKKFKIVLAPCLIGNKQIIA
jgi:hypothetical protein